MNEQNKVVTGAFIDSLKRNNKQIREDRAQSIAEDAQLLYKRQIEDLEVLIRKMKLEQQNSLDLSPSDAQSLKLATDFKGNEFVATDLKLGLDIRNSEIKLDIAKQRYEFLFGKGE